MRVSPLTASSSRRCGQAFGPSDPSEPDGSVVSIRALYDMTVNLATSTAGTRTASMQQGSTRSGRCCHSGAQCRQLGAVLQ